jgi:hypothetical protein
LQTGDALASMLEGRNRLVVLLEHALKTSAAMAALATATPRTAGNTRAVLCTLCTKGFIRDPPLLVVLFSRHVPDAWDRTPLRAAVEPSEGLGQAISRPVTKFW